MKDEAVGKAKIEAIYPLSTMQQGILFHHLTVKNDQGFLNVQCIIDGDLNIDILKKSWDLTINRHPILRTSVHWEKIKIPVQIVKPNGFINWSILDWNHLNKDVQEKQLIQLKEGTKKTGLDFQKNPLSNISLIKTKNDSHIFVWSCHHLLLDGWSSSIILKDVFNFYDSLTTNKNSNFENIPSYKSYLNFLNQINIDEAKQFWNKTFEGFEKPFLFNESQSKIEKLRKNQIQLSHETKLKAQNLSKSYQITINTLFQGVWSIILSKYSNYKDIAYGNTVSGRSGNFPNIELIAGMFANVLPVRAKIDFDSKLNTWFKDLQNQQLKARKFEHYNTTEITEWIGDTSNNLFDSLFIFENFPWNDIKAANIRVHSSESGITTTYPLTLTIKIEDSIDIYLISDISIFSKEANDWFLNRFEEIINIIDNNKDGSLETILEKTKPINYNIKKQVLELSNNTHVPVAPKNKIELELLKIWEELLDKAYIGVQDHFFQIGGKSLLAIKMFTLIKKKLKISISPITLLEHPTIEALSKYIIADKHENSWKYIVPMRSKGNKKPLFCIHGGGGYVFFFNPIVNALNKKRPVYALQPAGLNSKEEMHESIQEMAKDYANEIKDIQPKGPYNLLVYCFSPAVGIEIANIFEKLGEETNLIILDSIIKQEDFTDPTRIKMRISGFINRLKSNPFNAIKLMLSNNYERFIEPTAIKLFASSNKKHLERIKQNLIKIYKQYEWDKKHPGTASLILTDKPDKKVNKAYIVAWEDITNNKVAILKTEGQHHQLFSSPYADLAAKQIEKAIVEID